MDQTIKAVEPGVRLSPAQWAAIMLEYELRGMSAKAFCVQKGLAFSTFCRWRRELKLRGVAGQEQFVPVVRQVPEPPAPKESRLHVELDLGGGMLLRVQRG